MNLFTMSPENRGQQMSKIIPFASQQQELHSADTNSRKDYSRRTAIGFGIAALSAIAFVRPAQAVAAVDPAQQADINVLRVLRQVGEERRITPKVRLAMFETAWVESKANNVDHGDLDSLGVFQQRASWGTVE